MCVRCGAHGKSPLSFEFCELLFCCTYNTEITKWITTIHSERWLAQMFLFPCSSCKWTSYVVRTHLTFTRKAMLQVNTTTIGRTPNAIRTMNDGPTVQLLYYLPANIVGQSQRLNASPYTSTVWCNVHNISRMGLKSSVVGQRYTINQPFMYAVT